MHFVTPACKQLGSYSVCLLHAHLVQAGLKLLPFVAHLEVLEKSMKMMVARMGRTG